MHSASAICSRSDSAPPAPRLTWKETHSRLSKLPTPERETAPVLHRLDDELLWFGQNVGWGETKKNIVVYCLGATEKNNVSWFIVDCNEINVIVELQV